MLTKYDDGENWMNGQVLTMAISAGEGGGIDEDGIVEEGYGIGTGYRLK